MKDEEDGGVASLTEVWAAVNALTPRDMGRLRDFAYQLFPVPMLGVTGEDLVDEALQRLMSPNSRHWKRKDPFFESLVQIIRSIANGYRRKAEVRNDIEGRVPSEDEASVPLAKEKNPELRLIEEQHVDIVLNTYRESPAAYQILEAVALGFITKSEIKEVTGMSEADYNSGRKAIQRGRPKVEKALQGELGDDER